MLNTVQASRFVRVAPLIDHLSQSLELERIGVRARQEAITELEALCALLTPVNDPGLVLRRALLRLKSRLEQPVTVLRARPADQVRNRRLTRSLRRIAAIVAAVAAATVPLAAAAAVREDPGPTRPLRINVGDPITHPVTGVVLTVTAVVPNGVIATGDLFILTTTMVGAMIPDPANPAVNVTITSVVLNAGTGLVERVNYAGGSLDVVTAIQTNPGGAGGPVTLPPGVGDVNTVTFLQRGGGGGGGRDGALFVSANSGGNGGTGPSINETVQASNGDITTVSANRPGIIAASIGGNGGSGGDGYLGASGASGGNGGAGGTVNLTSLVNNISTTGDGSHGVVGQSRAGIGGPGGSGFVFSSGGSGGAGSTGGSVTVTNYSTITTRGVGAHGVFAQSLGGGAGSGGGSYGLFGDGGAGNRGGQGGSAEAINYGQITTIGDGSSGVTAQSVGGIGGDAGNAVGLVTFSDDGAPGGDGGSAVVRAQSGSRVQTSGRASYGLFAQSIGGGGGEGGFSVGLVSLGSGGGTGGNGSSASIFAQSNSVVNTTGEASHGIFAQSIGGGGGNGGVSGGLVAIGSRGTSGGTGGTVTVESGTNVSTTGLDARGIFAQSIGGGGGNALGAGGLVALGGEGGGAGGAGSVTVTATADSVINTTGGGGDGIFAQSVGGGGGTGSSSGGLAALGGDGGAGGNGGVVIVTNDGVIRTQGELARGIFAQSVGGGGGSGGDSGGLVTLGGAGSAASTGAAVTVTNNGAIQTGGARSSAIQVQSVGGGGGDGGSTGGVFLTIGGSGGSGGGSGLVTVNNSHNLTTTGADSHGILAQSIGGGGGNGGSTVSVSAFAGVAIGGSGAAGGNGGNVDVNFTSRTVVAGGISSQVDPTIYTTGDRSRGVFAQSVGGGGGAGGFAAQTSVGYGIAASAAVGGRGGAGGTGGLVTVDGDVTIITEGMSSEGLFAQSVGGGGGAGGFALSLAFSGGETVAGALAVGLGGAGGNGGAGGRVDVNSGGAIQTDGQFSTGLLAQSVGGGGGSGGFAVTVTGTGAGAVSGSVSVGMGGTGGNGGAGGEVEAEFDGTILTRDHDSGGAVIQSVGGGGGNGGFNVSAAVSFAGTAGVGAAVGLGGAGGGGGAGGTVIGHIRDGVQTDGDRSTGVTIQSVGGGGGAGGFNVSGAIGGGGTFGGGISVGLGGAGGGGGAGGTVTGSAETIFTQGFQSAGLIVQSVGGGGGAGAFNVSGSIGGGGTFGAGVSVGLGGSGGTGGAGGTVRGDALGFVETVSNQSAGVTVQSLGGGGGAGGFNVSGSIGGGGSAAGSVSVGLGGSGGGGGAGGQVDASSIGITTRGDQSTGFLAQSVGGGGGSGGFNVSGSIQGSGGSGAAVSVGLGGSGGGGGNGARVGATVTGNVTTLGDGSDAITAQSLGGGGGAGGFNVSAGISANATVSGAINVGLGGSGGGGGDAGAVTLNVTGTTQTAGVDSDAILAQSVGGGGGSGGFNVTGGIAASGAGAGTIGVGIGGTGGSGGDAGAVTLNVNAGVADPTDTLVAVLTLEDGSSGITAQSLGGGGGSGGFNVTGGVAIAKTGAGNIGVGVGGGGGDGGDAGVVNATLNGDVTTGGDDAHGLLIQSVGGGGGSGGFNVTAGISGSKTVAGNLLVGVGGFGGGGGNGAAVNTTYTGDIVTLGDNSFGASIQSLGGGGGAGGFNVTGGVNLTISSGGGSGLIGVGVGGFGGDGGTSGNVFASLTGDIATLGRDAHAALIQSVGGGGGAGGFNITGGMSLGTSASGALGVGIGGFGGGGGAAGTATGILNGDVTTLGNGAYGALIQSLGGGGGAGGMNVTGNVAFTTTSNPSVALGFGLGGFGGAGGAGAAASGTVTGQYATFGDGADAVTVQSLGGGGGAGGMNVTGSIALGLGTSGTASIGIGGFGGGGGNSGTASLTRVGDTFTDGANSDGIVVQSVAGGGGSGGLNVSGGIAGTTQGTSGGFSFGLGGFGGGGGDAGDVTASITGNVIATGVGSDTYVPGLNVEGFFPGLVFNIPAYRERLNGSHGVMVQSVGGGGGTGGLNVTGQITLASPGGAGSARTAAIGIGGFGGAGGDAGNVDLTIGAPGVDRVQMVATGDDRVAVTAQSLGGGGGAGGINVSGGVAMDGQLVVGIGGFGGAGGLGRNVTANIDADIFAGGNRSRGLMIQSIGGGGGHGGINISGGFTADTGTTEPSLVFGLGGFGGAGNASGDVDATHNGLIWVDGAEATGALIQSVAGGGGSGGLNVAANVSLSGGTSRLNGFAFAGGMGGNGGAGADAGDVIFNSTGDVVVNGRLVGGLLVATDTAFGGAGVIVQSIGGGGGTGGINVVGAVAPFGQPVAVGVGGSGGAGGHGGTVDVTRGYRTPPGGSEVVDAGLIRTFGTASTGMLAQSVGGGGGNTYANVVLAVTGRSQTSNPLAVTAAIGGNGGDAGDGDTVTVRHAGDIVTSGSASDGLHAQSLGGGGGTSYINVAAGLMYEATAMAFALGGTGGAAGSGGDVSVEHDGFISTTGYNSVGIRAQSIGGGGGNASFDIAAAPLANNSVSLTIGRTGGTGGTGGAVSVTSGGEIRTLGNLSSGIMAQSIGGGGGASGSITVGVSGTRGMGNDAASYSAGVSVGLQGGTGATGGNVTVDNSALIVTQGEDARGILAQSIGGGGGVGGTAANMTIRAAGGASVAVGGQGGTGATSGTVTVSSSDRIATMGARSDGILAQSIGGGGGIGGHARTLAIQLGGSPGATSTNTASVNVGGTGGTGANAGAVSVTNTGVITTTGVEGYGIRAQSIGGGGGVGGAAINFRAQGTRNNNDLSVTIGGSGGNGGAGGRVDVLNEGLIMTSGRDAAGISANSIGGGGGDGGLVLDVVAGGTTSAQQSNRIAVNVGGNGGTGGTGGDVSVINRPTGALNSGTIVTTGAGSYGVFAQSLGGGGGNGSSVISFTGMYSGRDSVSVGLNFGGNGGSGNSGGTVTVLNQGLIDTSGVGSHGVLAQSIGGGGGNGGMAIAGNFLIGAPTGSPLISIGGVGGGGGSGGAVTVTNSGNIVTRGANAHGIVAQSIGGGGGNANLGFALTTEPGSLVISNALSALIGLTGGGAGGAGGTVTVNHSGDITVLGEGSIAVLAESINGGGGTLKLDFTGITGLPGVPFIGGGGVPVTPQPLVVARAGGNGSTSMNAGLVTVNTTGTFGAGGRNALGSLTQAIGGGGGTVSVRALLAALNDFTVTGPTAPMQFQLDLGGIDGSGNNGGDIFSSHTGTLTTMGDNAPGALIQSIGGGGGRGLLDLYAPPGTSLGAVSVSLGGVNGVNSAGGDIARIHAGRIATGGDLSAGAIIQSIGGGGGSLSVSISNVAPTPAPVPAPAPSDGGTPADDGRQVLPGAGPSTGAKSDGREVLPGATGGDSKGDGRQVLPGASDGGSKDDGRQVLPGTDEGGSKDEGPQILPGAPDGSSKNDRPQVLFGNADLGDRPEVLPGDEPLAAPGDPFTARLGAVGGSGLHGGDIDATFSGGVLTLGDHSPGLIVQSIGAGGGDLRLMGVNAPAITLGGSAGASGNGGFIDLTNGGDVMTAGDGSHGVFLQSIGGGGGAVFGAFTGATVTLSAANAGNGGSIAFNQTGDIVTSGAAAHGLVTQSLGGGGGWVQGVFAGSAGGAGSGGTIDMNVSGAIFTPGAGSVGVWAQSLGALGAGNISLISNGLIRGGTGTGAGVRYAGGAANLIRTSGSISAVSGLAIDTGTGNDRVENTGLIVGNVDLGSGANAVFNNVGGTFVAFNTIDLRDGIGSTGTFTNSGDYLMGLAASRYPIDLAAGETFGNLDGNGAPATNLLFGARVINTVALDGHYVQTAAGHLAFDIAFGPYASDIVNVTGDATVDGTGEVILTWLENGQRRTLFSTVGVGVDNGLDIADTLAMDYFVEADADGVHLDFVSNFGQPFLNRNGQRLGLHMDAAIEAGGSAGIGRLMALIGNLQVGDEDYYSYIFNELNLEPLTVPGVIQYDAARDFAGQVFSCGTTLEPETERCAWAQLETTSYERTGDFEYYGVESQGGGRFRAGFERPIWGDHWMLGGAFGYDKIGATYVDGGRAVFEGDGFHGGLGLRRTTPSGYQMGVSTSFGWQSVDSMRFSNVFEPLRGDATLEGGYARMDAEVARIFSDGTLFMRPALRTSLTALHRASFEEEGMAGLGGGGYDDTDVFATLNPEVTFGVKMFDSGGNSGLAAITIGGVFQSNDEIVTPMRLLGSNPDTPIPAYISTPIDEEAWRVGADFRILGNDGMSLRFNYVGEFGKDAESHSGGVNLRFRF